MSDEALMSLVQEGDDQAFKVLFDKYKRPIMSYVYQFHKRAELVEEITHEVFLKVYKSRASYRSEYKFNILLTPLFQYAPSSMICHHEKPYYIHSFYRQSRSLCSFN